ncbi:hypothetical protein ACJX0J_021190, partial [Zea mays]
EIIKTSSRWSLLRDLLEFIFTGEIGQDAEACSESSTHEETGRKRSVKQAWGFFQENAAWGQYEDTSIYLTDVCIIVQQLQLTDLIILMASLIISVDLPACQIPI